MTNRKSLKIMHIAKDEIVMELTSENPLNTIGRAMRKFTFLLLKHNDRDFSAAVTASGALFTYTTLNKIEDNQPEDPSAAITDADFYKALVDYSCNHRDTNTSIYKKKRDAIQEMKRLAVASGIILVNKEECDKNNN